MGDIYTNPPQSRNEAILRATIDGTEYTDPPQSRIEDLLIELKEAIEQGGGSVESYEQLTNKPQINGTTLSIDNLTEANPSDSATGELSKLKVGSDIYSVVTKAVNDLTNYYTKSEVYTKAEVNNIAQARFAVVAELPTEDIQTNVIYLVPKSTAQTNNDYDEYIYALKSTNQDTYGWEKIGDTEIDLSDYVTTQALNTALADYTTTTDLTTLLAGKQNALTFDATPTAQSTNPVTSGGIKSYIDEQGAKTVSGNPITITDAEGMNADHVVATITPTQDLHGYSKPWAGGTGKNKLAMTVDSIKSANSGATWTDNEATIDGIKFTILTDSDGNVTGINADGKATSSHVYLILNGNFNSTALSAYIVNGLPNNSAVRFRICNQSNFNPIEDCYNNSTIHDNGNGLRFTLRIEWNTTLSNVIFYPMICLASETDTTFAPYTNICGFSGQTNAVEITVFDAPTDQTETKTYTVQLGDTYYQANIDVTRGVLRCEQKTVDLGSFEWTLNQNDRGRADSTTSISDAINPSKNSDKADMLSDRYQVLPYYVNGQEGVDAWGTDGSFGVQGNSANNKLYVRDINFEGLTAAQVKTALTGSKILYKLATPIEIQLTPTQIALLENNNTITTNVSSLDITYQTNTGIGDTASALDKRVTRLESKVPQPPTTDGTYKLTVTVASGTQTYSWESAT